MGNVVLEREAGVSAEDAGVFQAQTISELFLQRVFATPNDLAYEYMDESGAWRSVSYNEYGEQVQQATLGLHLLGIREEVCVSIWGNTMPEWTVLNLAAQSAGGHVAGIYQTSTADQAAYIIQDSGSQVLCVDTWERVQPLLAMRDQIPTIVRVIVWAGAVPEDAPDFVSTYGALMASGKAHAAANEGAYEEFVARVRPEMKAVLVYTSGTTGPPKGVILTHDNCMSNAKGIFEYNLYQRGDSMVAFLPMSHVAEYMTFLGRIIGGMTAFFCPDFAKVGDAIRAKCPTIVVAVPRVYEKVHHKILAAVEHAPPRKKQIFHWALKVGDEVAKLKAQKKPVPIGLMLRHGLADRLVLSKIRAQLGGKVRVMFSAAAPIDVEIIDFFMACGFLFLEAYGLSESCGASHVNLPDNYKVGTVGKPVKGLECIIAEDGEILMRGPTIFSGYLNKPEQTAEMLDDSGWLHTGDIGEIDADGFLRITDRKKNLLITAGGKNVAPAPIEMLIKRDPLVSQVVVLGDRKPFLVALCTINADVIAEDSLSPEAVQERVAKAVEDANTHLPRHEQIKQFRTIDHEFSIESGEMTPTMKIKRNVVVQHYQSLLDEMYAAG
jgi:long-chain acyl-CoA synthetase